MSSEFVDDILLTVDGASWPVEDGLPVGTSRATMSLDREIVASTLPGQARTRTGFSIGSASVTIPQAPGRQLTPWSPSSDRLITTGNPATLSGLAVSGKREPLGAWQVKKASGSLTSGSVHVELAESQYAGRTQRARFAPVGAVEPVWIIDQLARQAGFFSTPAPAPGVVLDAPLCGSVSPQVGRLHTDAVTPVWDEATGIVGLSPATGTKPIWSLTDDGPAGSFRAAFNGGFSIVGFRLFPSSNSAAVWLDVNCWTHGVFYMRINGGGWVQTTYTPGLNPDWPTRVEVAFERDGATIRARVRSTNSDTAWSAWISVPFTGDSIAPHRCSLQGGMLGSISGLQVGTGPMSWTPPTARLSLLDGTVVAPWVAADADAWTALQDTCGAFAAAGWVDRHGVLTVINRHELAGSGRPKTLIDVDRLAEDIAWTLDDDDLADRLEVTWRPVSWPEVDEGEWPVGDKVHVPAGASATVEVDLGGYVRTVNGFADYITAGPTDSEWQANTAADGSGTDVTAGIGVTVSHPSPSRALVTVTNTTASDVWMVDFTGNPAMILRGSGAALQESPQVITYGKQAFEARLPLSVDLGHLVQSKADADELAGYIWERVNRARWRADSVRLPLDWSRDLGDILVLDHPGSGLSVNALVTAVRIESGPGFVRQTCDLIVLPPTWDEWDSAWRGMTGTAFDAVWAGRTGTAFDNDPLKTEV